MAIVVDLEAVAADGVELDPVTAPANYKDPDKIAAYIAEAEAAQREKLALHPWSARIIALGWCEETDEAVHVEACNNEAAEKRVLTEFWSRVVDPRTHAVTNLVTYNGRAYDLPLLMARSILLGVRCPELNVDKYRSPHPDLLQKLTWNGAVQYRSLRFFAKRFGLNTDDAFSGKEIAQLYAAGDWESIAKHVESDVTLTRQLAERLGVLRPRPVAA